MKTPAQQTNHSPRSLQRPGGTAAARSPATRPLGAHMWATGGIHRAIDRGAAIGCDVIQVFTRNPNQWEARPLTAEQLGECRRVERETGVRLLAAHDSYLINLATADRTIRRRSLTAMVDELDRAEQLDIQWVVTHMGAHLGAGVEVGLDRFIEGLDLSLDRSLSRNVRVALEVTAGQGTTLGFEFEHLARVLDRAHAPDRFGVCVDTCHVHVAGYSWRGQSAYEALWSEFDAIIGLDRLALIHANDAKRERGSRVDRHEHLGRGRIGLATFRRLVRDPKLAHVPLLLETPEAETMHRENLRLLRSFRRRH